MAVRLPRSVRDRLETGAAASPLAGPWIYAAWTANRLLLVIATPAFLYGTYRADVIRRERRAAREAERSLSLDDAEGATLADGP